MPKKGKELTVETREYVVSLIDQGVRVGEVAKLLDLNRSTVGKIYEQYCISNSVENQPRSGRPKVFIEWCETALSRIVKRNRTATVSEICAEFEASTSTAVIGKIIKRKLHELGFQKRVAVKTVAIRQVNRKTSLQNCKKNCTGLSTISEKR